MDDGFVGIAGEIDDIQSFPNQESITQELIRLGVGKDRNAIPTQTAKAYQQFAMEIEIGDLVVMRSAKYFVGVGKVISDYQYDATAWPRIASAFPELEIWFVSESHFDRCPWSTAVESV